MALRIIAGRFRRHPLHTPKGLNTRPTTDRVREAMFNLLVARMDFEDIPVLDLFAGTGALGFEALSRGAKQVTFVEHNRQVVALIRQNAAALGVARVCTLLTQDVKRFFERPIRWRYPLVLADPPYDWPDVAQLPDWIMPYMTAGAFFVLEHDTRHDFSGHAHFILCRSYGETQVSLFGATPA